MPITTAAVTAVAAKLPVILKGVGAIGSFAKSLFGGKKYNDQWYKFSSDEKDKFWLDLCKLAWEQKELSPFEILEAGMAKVLPSWGDSDSFEEWIIGDGKQDPWMLNTIKYYEGKTGINWKKAPTPPIVPNNNKPVVPPANKPTVQPTVNTVTTNNSYPANKSSVPGSNNTIIVIAAIGALIFFMNKKR